MILNIAYFLFVIAWVVLVVAATIPRFGIWFVSNLSYFSMYIGSLLRFKTHNGRN